MSFFKPMELLNITITMISSIFLSHNKAQWTTNLTYREVIKESVNKKLIQEHMISRRKTKYILSKSIILIKSIDKKENQGMCVTKIQARKPEYH